MAQAAVVCILGAHNLTLPKRAIGLFCKIQLVSINNATSEIRPLEEYETPAITNLEDPSWLDNQYHFLLEDHLKRLAHLRDLKIRGSISSKLDVPEDLNLSSDSQYTNINDSPVSNPESLSSVQMRRVSGVDRLKDEYISPSSQRSSQNLSPIINGSSSPPPPPPPPSSRMDSPVPGPPPLPPDDGLLSPPLPPPRLITPQSHKKTISFEGSEEVLRKRGKMSRWKVPSRNVTRTIACRIQLWTQHRRGKLTVAGVLYGEGLLLNLQNLQQTGEEWRDQIQLEASWSAKIRSPVPGHLIVSLRVIQEKKFKLMTWGFGKLPPMTADVRLLGLSLGIRWCFTSSCDVSEYALKQTSSNSPTSQSFSNRISYSNPLNETMKKYKKQENYQEKACYHFNFPFIERGELRKRKKDDEVDDGVVRLRIKTTSSVSEDFPDNAKSKDSKYKEGVISITDFHSQEFSHLRRDIFGMTDTKLLSSLCDGPLISLGESKGKSGAGFYQTKDSRLLVKSMTKEELNLLLEILPQYIFHCQIHTQTTLLPRFYGCFTLNIQGSVNSRRTTINEHYVVMTNIFDEELPIHYKYDLKGSTIGRSAGKTVIDQDASSAALLIPNPRSRVATVITRVQTASKLGRNRSKSDDRKAHRIDMSDLEKKEDYEGEEDPSWTKSIWKKKAHKGMTKRSTSMDNLWSDKGKSKNTKKIVSSLTPGRYSRSSSNGSRGDHDSNSNNNRSVSNMPVVTPNTVITNISTVNSEMPPKTERDSIIIDFDDDIQASFLTTPTVITTSTNIATPVKSKKLRYDGVATITVTTTTTDTTVTTSNARRRRTITNTEYGVICETILKDIDFRQGSHRMALNEEDAQSLRSQIKKDTDFLKSLQIMDYSMLLGIHQTSLQAFPRDYSMSKGCGVQVLHAKEKNNLYFIGIIDILQRYNTKKKLEHGIKSIPYDSKKISAVDPNHYARRFFQFLNEVIEQ